MNTRNTTEIAERRCSMTSASDIGPASHTHAQAQKTLYTTLTISLSTARASELDWRILWNERNYEHRKSDDVRLKVLEDRKGGGGGGGGDGGNRMRENEKNIQ